MKQRSLRRVVSTSLPFPRLTGEAVNAMTLGEESLLTAGDGAIQVPMGVKAPCICIYTQEKRLLTKTPSLR
jgi:hypothetical protein